MKQWNVIRNRDIAGMSQEDMAKMLGESVVTYRNKELGRVQFKADEMFKLADYFDTSLDKLFLDPNKGE